MLSPDDIAQQRQQVIAEALSWEWTRFRWHTCIKGPEGGCDCGQLLKASYSVVGINAILPQYSTQFFQHRDDELYIRALEVHCIKVSQPQPGDIVVFQMGRAFGHAGIIVKWPMMIHAHGRAQWIEQDSAIADPDLGWREKQIWSLRQWHEG